MPSPSDLVKTVNKENINTLPTLRYIPTIYIHWTSLLEASYFTPKSRFRVYFQARLISFSKKGGFDVSESKSVKNGLLSSSAVAFAASIEYAWLVCTWIGWSTRQICFASSLVMNASCRRRRRTFSENDTRFNFIQNRYWHSGYALLTFHGWMPVLLRITFIFVARLLSFFKK